jgi:hypothetical protein
LEVDSCTLPGFGNGTDIDVENGGFDVDDNDASGLDVEDNGEVDFDVGDRGRYTFLGLFAF